MWEGKRVNLPTGYCKLVRAGRREFELEKNVFMRSKYIHRSGDCNGGHQVAYDSLEIVPTGLPHSPSLIRCSRHPPLKVIRHFLLPIVLQNDSLKNKK